MAYQAVKHNRTFNLSKGNIKNLLRAMGALYLLNLYYRADIFDVFENNSTIFADSLSELFNIKVHNWIGDSNTKESYVKQIDFEECTFLIKWTNEYKKQWSEFVSEQGKSLKDMIFNHPRVKQHISDNLTDNGKLKEPEFTIFIQNREYLTLFDMKKEYGDMIHSAMLEASNKTSFNVNQKAQYEAVLNMNQQIYPLE